MTSYSLFELNEFIRQVIALNFHESIWLTAEIAQLDLSKGNCYLNLVQKEEDNDRVIAQSAAIIWKSTYSKLKRKLGETFNNLLQEGVSIKIQVKVDFHERYGLKLMVQDIDLTYTLGKFALQRQATIDRLQQEGLIGKNTHITAPPVLQRIAVISSQNAAGLQDYITQLEQNNFGYAFQNALFPAAVQGIHVQRDVLRQLQQIKLRQAAFDVVVIIRGGGSRLDLAAFDQFEICEAVANFPIPVLTGIGHEVDESILDLVAFQALKTPTAVADFLINHNLKFESDLHHLFQSAQQQVQNTLFSESNKISQYHQYIQLASHQQLQRQHQQMDYLGENLSKNVHFLLREENAKLDNFNKIYALLSPEATLKRGFSMVLKNGKSISDPQHLKEGDIIETQMLKGRIQSEVKKVAQNKDT